MNEKENKWQELMDAAYDKWENKSRVTYPEFVSNLSFKEKCAVLTGNFNYQVHNGGIHQWIFNGYAVEINRMIDILEIIDGQFSNKLQEILEILEPYINKNPDEINYLLIEETAEDEEHPLFEDIDAMTNEFYSFSKEWKEEIENFIILLDKVG